MQAEAKKQAMLKTLEKLEKEEAIREREKAQVIVKKPPVRKEAEAKRLALAEEKRIAQEKQRIAQEKQRIEQEKALQLKREEALRLKEQLKKEEEERRKAIQ